MYMQCMWYNVMWVSRHHNIIQIHTSALWDQQYSMEYSHICIECEEYSVEHYQSHIALLF